MNAGAAAAPALSAADVSVRLTGALIVDRATLELKAGELTALIGPNGAGKTTPKAASRSTAARWRRCRRVSAHATSPTCHRGTSSIGR